VRRKVWTFNVAVDFWRHPKAIQAGRDGRDLFLCALGWSGEYRQNGHIPVAALDQLAALVGISRPAALRARARLVAVGLWEPEEGGWLIHDYLDWQMSAEERDRRAEEAAQRQRDYAARKAAEARQPDPPDPPHETRHDASYDATDDTSHDDQRGVRGEVVVGSSGLERELTNPSATNGVHPDSPSPDGEQKDQVRAQFLDFWDAFPKRGGRLRDKDRTLAKWRRMTSSERSAALQALPNYAAERGDDKPTNAADPLRWLQQRTWRDYLDPVDQPTNVRLIRPPRRSAADALGVDTHHGGRP
jgi:hypothetical protein